MTRYPLFVVRSVYFNIALHPCQRLITLNGVDLSHFSFDSFILGKTVFPSTTGHPDRWSICQNHRGMPLCGYFFFVQKLVKYLRSRCASTNHARTAADRPYLIFVFIYIYDGTLVLIGRIFNLKGVLMLQIDSTFSDNFSATSRKTCRTLLWLLPHKTPAQLLQHGPWRHQVKNFTVKAFFVL